MRTEATSRRFPSKSDEIAAAKARVRNGRFVLDEPTELPEGTEVELLLLDPGDWLDPEDRALLHRALAASREDLENGRLVDAEEVLRELRGAVTRRRVPILGSGRQAEVGG
jgi:hypothetical protein